MRDRMIVLKLLLLWGIALSAQESGGLLDPRDGRSYQTVRIGEQLWMAENLNFTLEKAPAIYPNNSPLSDNFGRLYCWEAACEVCPDGWHLPTEAEWSQLASYLGGEKIAGGKMKKVSPFWSSKNEESNNESGFSALPGGFLEDPSDHSYPYMGDMGFFWSATEKSGSDSYFRYLKIDGTALKTGSGSKESGMSVRCLED